MPRQALLGAAIAGGFGGLWAVWGASGLHGSARMVVSVVGVVLGLAVVVPALVVARRATTEDGRSMFTSRTYRVTVALEVVALVVGNVLLGRAGLNAYIVAWTAFVVGVHFLAFGRAFDRVFTAIGGLMVGAAVVGVVVGLAGAGDGAVVLVAGLLSAAILLGAGARTVGGALRAREQ